MFIACQNATEKLWKLQKNFLTHLFTRSNYHEILNNKKNSPIGEFFFTRNRYYARVTDDLSITT
jgi:hypothetical protein